MSLDSRIVRIAGWIAVVLALAWVYQRVAGTIRVIPADRATPDAILAMRDLRGAEVRLESYRGQVVVLNLWASWCGPCRREIPSLNAIAERYADRGLVVLGLNVDEGEPDDIAAIARGLGVTFPVLRPAEALDGPFDTPGVIPHTWLIDRAGRVRASHSGVASSAGFDRAARRLLDE